MFSFAKSESKCLKIVRKEKSSKHQKETKKKLNGKKRIFIFAEDYMPWEQSLLKWLSIRVSGAHDGNLLADLKPR